MHDFLGKYALGSGANWEQGTDYDNSEHKKNMLESITKMVNEFKDEPYVLMWLIGNENVYGLGCNADKKPESFFKFANEAARLIKSLDPKNRPVIIASGDTLYLDLFAKFCPDLDVFGTNSYRGKYGFLDIWDEVKRLSGKPAMAAFNESLIEFIEAMWWAIALGLVLGGVIDCVDLQEEGGNTKVTMRLKENYPYLDGGEEITCDIHHYSIAPAVNNYQPDLPLHSKMMLETEVVNPLLADYAEIQSL